MESFNQDLFHQATGLDIHFVQDNFSRSAYNVLRGLHYQVKQPQGRLVQVVSGRVFDVAVDMRQSSPMFGRWYGLELSGENHRQLWIPAGFAHGFLVLSAFADFLYKTTAYYVPELKRTLLWCDPAIAVDWPLWGRLPQLSARDRAGKNFLNLFLSMRHQHETSCNRGERTSGLRAHALFATFG